MRIRVVQANLHVLNMRTRMPFKYGIATLLALPHLIVRAAVEVDGKRQHGIAADGLPPKWFTKDPNTTFAADLRDMLEVIRSACDLAATAPAAASVFDFWRSVYDAQSRWAQQRSYPPLLWNFGVSLIERAVIDAFCRSTGGTFASALHQNSLGIRLGDLHPELTRLEPRDLLPPAPLERIRVRHTVGLADPLTTADVPPGERIADGLPQTLEESIHTFGLTHFKIKISGDPDHDLHRLRRIESVLHQHSPRDAFTLDGNENYRALEPFRHFWNRLVGETSLSPFLARLIFIEQPLHRDVALSEAGRRAMLDWTDRPPMIIDESDATIDSLPRALDSGYVGTSHKNCKGIFKGLANACLIAHRTRTEPQQRHVLSAEDLANVGPIALLQDCAVLAALGIPHAERNGHHYFAGLSAFPSEIQAATLQYHPDLYHRHNGFPTLTITDGTISLNSINAAPFGVGFEPDLSRLIPLEHWDPASLDLQS